jgi:hypothetical protein
MCIRCHSIFEAADPVECTSGGAGSLFPGDGWSHWQGDPERAFREHNPALEPYASMSRDEIVAAMLAARGGREWEFLREFLLDKCSEEEREYDRFMAILADVGGLTSEELYFLSEMSGIATRLVRVPAPRAGGTEG